MMMDVYSLHYRHPSVDVYYPSCYGAPVCEACQQCSAYQIRESDALADVLYAGGRHLKNFGTEAVTFAAKGVQKGYHSVKGLYDQNQNTKTNADRPEKNILRAVTKYCDDINKIFLAHSKNIKSMNGLPLDNYSAGVQSFNKITETFASIDRILKFYESAIQSRTTTRDVPSTSKSLPNEIQDFSSKNKLHTTTFATTMRAIVQEIKYVKDFVTSEYVSYDPFYPYQYTTSGFYQTLTMIDKESIKNLKSLEPFKTKMPGCIETLLGSIGRERGIYSFPFQAAGNEILSYLKEKKVEDAQIKDIVESMKGVFPQFEYFTVQKNAAVEKPLHEDFKQEDSRDEYSEHRDSQERDSENEDSENNNKREGDKIPLLLQSGIGIQ